MTDAFRHFAVVGLAFALLVGWLATLIVNTALGALLEAVLHARATNYYFGSALLTAVSILLIALCIVTGNRLFVRWFPRARLSRPAVFISAALFLLVVLVFVAPQVGQVISAYADHTRYFYHHGSDLLLMLSLPLARLVVLPPLYFISTMRSVYATNCT